MKVGAGTGGTPRASFFYLPLLPLIFILSACPPPVSDQLATAVADKLPPTITVTTPKAGQSYSASVTFTGTITDDASSAGDAKGMLRAIDYTVANDVLRKGKITIDTNGNATQDTSFGSGTVSWTRASGTFSFALSTVTPTSLRGLITVTIDATDANGNKSSSIVQLSEGSGPVISLTSPAGTNLKYISGTTVVTLTGTVANASDDLTHDDNIASVAWGVTGKDWGAAIAVVEGTTSYAVPNAGGLTGTDFTFDTTTRTFLTSFTVPFINDQSLILTVTATDKNGHTTASTNYLVADVSGPQLSITSATSGLYYSPVYYTPPVVTGNVDVSTLQTMTLQLTTSGGYASSVITVYPTNGTGNTSDYSFDTNSSSPTYGDFRFLMQGALGTATLLGASGTATVTIMAANSDNVATKARYTILMDSASPSITDVVLSTSNSNATHTKVGDTITLSFKASDALSGLNGYPAVTIAGHAITMGTPVGTTYNAQYVMQSSDSAYDNLGIPYSISATDNVGNLATSNATSSILFYESPPTLSTVTIASNNAQTAWAREGNTLTLSFQTARDLQAVPAVKIATHAVSASPATTTAHSYTATCLMAAGDAQGMVPFSIDITDAAGNVATQVTTVTSGSNVTYDNIAPSGHSATIDQNPIYSGNQTAVSFTLAGAEVGTGCSYSLNSSGGGPAVIGNGTISSATQQVTGINVTGLGDGTLTLSVTLTDAAGNAGTAAASTRTKDATPPSGYSATITQIHVNISNQTNISMSFAGAETTASYTYTISSSGGGTNVTGTGTVSSPTQGFSGLDVSGLTDGTLTVALTLTDTAGNTGSTVTTTRIKDTVIPSGYSATIDQAHVNSSNRTAISFTFVGAEVGASYSYSLTGPSGSPVTGNGTISSTTQQVTNINVNGLGDGTLTLSVTLTDAAGNAGTAATSTKTKDTVAPSSYTVGIDQNPIYSGNQTAVSFTFVGAEVGASCSYSITGPSGPPVTGNGTIVTGTDTISGLNVSGLGDGTIALSATLTDTAGNAGTAASSTMTKDATPPSGYSATITQAHVNFSNQAAITMSFAGAETGAHFSYTISSSGGGTNVTGTGTVSSPAQSFSGLDVSGLGDGVLSVSLTLTDTAGNAGTPVTTTRTKDTAPPSITAVTMNTGSTTATVDFSEGVYKNSDGTGSLGSDSVTITIVGSSPLSTATVSTVSHTAGSSTAVYTITGWSHATPVATTDSIQVDANANSIYDAAGNVTAGGSSGSGTARFLSLFGIHVKPAVLGSTRSTSALSRVGAWLPQTIAVRAPVGSIAIAGGPAGLPVSTSPAPVNAVREQFHAALPVIARMPAAETVTTVSSQSTSQPPGDPAKPPTRVALAAADRQPAIMQAPSTTGSLPIGEMTRAAQEDAPSSASWWVLGLGVLAIAGLTTGAWFGIRLLRDRVGRP